MATYSATSAKTITLVANTVDTITLTGAGNNLHVFQTSSTPVYFSVAQPGQTPITPTVGGDDCIGVMNGNNSLDIPWSGNGVVIKVISAGTGTINFALHGL